MQSPQNQTTPKPDWLAICFIGSFGSSNGRADNALDAILRCKMFVESDWVKSTGYRFKNPVAIEVYDVTGHDDFSWKRSRGIVSDKGVVIEPAYCVTAKLKQPKPKKKK